jgi:hypothetical protein
MKRFAMLLAAALVLLSLTSPVAAKARFGLHLGVQKAQDADNANTIFGALVRSKAEDWAIEASIDYRQEKYFNDEVTVRTWPVMLTLLYYPIPVLHGDFGAGWFNTTIDYSQDINDLGKSDYTAQRFGWHFGGGVEFPLETVTLTADVRYVFLDYKWKYVPGTSGRKGDFYMLTFGVSNTEVHSEGHSTRN